MLICPFGVGGGNLTTVLLAAPLQLVLNVFVAIASVVAAHAAGLYP